MSEENMTTPPPLRDDSLRQQDFIQPGNHEAPFTPDNTPGHSRRPMQRCMEFQESITACFKKYATFKGRATRAEYWWFELFCFLVSFILGLGEGLFSPPMGNGTVAAFADCLSLLFFVVTFLPHLAVGVRRLHDRDHTGWWLLIGLTIIGLIPLFIFMCLPSGPVNKYGDVPCTADSF
ncbi:MAG: DUF805 domain-containing protein [Desulfovibrionaceae bacterium]|nr:DUF805 domain-containing protein [Desulfovibrionaceae bacterium]